MYVAKKGAQACTCKHLKEVRGAQEEDARVAASAGAAPAHARAGPAKAKAAPAAKPASGDKPSINTRITLAQQWKPGVCVTGYLLSEKLDGMRAFWDGEKMWSRTGKPVHAPEWFLQGLAGGTELDGELFLGRGRFQDCMSIVRRTDQPQSWETVKFVVFDAPSAAGGIAERLKAAEKAVSRAKYAVLHPHSACAGEDELVAELAKIEAAGGEGLMLRNPTAAHRGGRTSDLLKVKSFHDDEALVTGYEAGKGKHHGRMGAVVCKLRSGKVFKVGSGFTDQQRETQNRPKVGDVITFKYFELTVDKIPRFPTFLRARPDVSADEFA